MNAASDVVIRVQNLSKCYQIYDKPQDRLKQAIIPRLRRIAGPFRRSDDVHYYREFWALKNVSFEVARGETLGIIGRNGAGKSTLLQLIAGTLSPTSGTAEVHGKVAALLELGSGFNPDFTGKENVYLNAALLGFTNDQIDARYSDILAFADIGEFIDQPLKTYSSGMMLRLAFAVQAAVEPALLIVDEALAVGDAKFQRKCYDHMERFRARGGTIMFVTHDTGTIVQLCNRAIILEKGTIYDAGKPAWISKVYHRLLFGEPNAGNVEKLETIQTSAKFSIDQATGQDVSNTTEDHPPHDTSNASREVRYGSGEIQIYEVGIRSDDGTPARILDLHGTYVFYFRARYYDDVYENVSFGFILRNTKGLEIYGTKGGQHAIFFKPARSGTVVEACMRLRMDLVPGTYFVTAGTARTNNDEKPFIDFRFDALEFQVVGNPRCFTTCIIDLEAEVWTDEKPRG